MAARSACRPSRDSASAGDERLGALRRGRPPRTGLPRLHLPDSRRFGRPRGLRRAGRGSGAARCGGGDRHGRQRSGVSGIKPISAAPDEQPALSPALLQLGYWISDYYGAPLGLALRAILPGPLWSVARPEGPGEAAERVLVLTERVESLLERERVFKRSPKRRAAYEAVEALGGSAPIRHLTDQLNLSGGVITGLVTQGLARIDHLTETRDPFAALSSPPPPTLTADQERVVAAIAVTPVSTPVLIHGVTGSGKTLLYLDVLRSIVASGAGAIVLVPEIALTPQTVARVRGVFGDQVAVLHSGLSDGERADAWRALRRGERRVAVGPRSAVFAPVQRLGAIV